MWVYHHLDYHQQVEILRRCTAEALADSDFIREREFVWDKEREALLIQDFRALRGITEIAHDLNCPEPRSCARFGSWDCMSVSVNWGPPRRYAHRPYRTSAERDASVEKSTCLLV